MAISADGTRWAFVLKQPSLTLGESRYGPYVRAADGTARKVAESSYPADLQARPGRKTWTLRGAFGGGMQVYKFDDAGRRTARLVHHPLVQVGGDTSLAPSASEPARATGALASRRRRAACREA